MKPTLLLFFTLLYLKGFSQSSLLDTIYCDIKNTSSIILKESVDFIDIGNPTDYAGQIKNNIVFIKPLKENISTTTLLINASGKEYYTTIKWQSKAKKYFYDYKNIFPAIPPTTGNVATSHLKAITTPSVTTQDGVQEKLKRFKEIGNEIKTLGIVGSTINVAVALIRNDHNNTYLKILVNNKSSIPFKLDFISFQYFQDMKKGAIRKSKKVPIDVFPVSEPSIESIEPLKTEALYYVIPTYALDNKGFLNINIREKTGDRILKLKIKGKTIQKSGQI